MYQQVSNILIVYRVKSERVYTDYQHWTCLAGELQLTKIEAMCSFNLVVGDYLKKIQQECEEEFLNKHKEKGISEIRAVTCFHSDLIES
jgi:hypothetical protein